MTPDRVSYCQIVCENGSVVNFIDSYLSEFICTVQLVSLPTLLYANQRTIIIAQSEEITGAHDSAYPYGKWLINQSGSCALFYSLFRFDIYRSGVDLSSYSSS